jgi:hypothetical protein
LAIKEDSEGLGTFFIHRAPMQSASKRDSVFTLLSGSQTHSDTTAGMALAKLRTSLHLSTSSLSTPDPRPLVLAPLPRACPLQAAKGSLRGQSMESTVLSQVWQVGAVPLCHMSCLFLCEIEIMSQSSPAQKRHLE